MLSRKGNEGSQGRERGEEGEEGWRSGRKRENWRRKEGARLWSAAPEDLWCVFRRHGSRKKKKKKKKKKQIPRR